MRFGVLGPVEVWDGEPGVALTLTPQARRLVALLASAPGSVVSTDRLAGAFGAEGVDGSSVRTAVSRLRKVVGSRVQADRGGYRLVLGGDDAVDAFEFEGVVGLARAVSVEERRSLLAGAVALWRGPAFEGFAGEEAFIGVAARLEELRLMAVEDLAESLIELGRHTEAVLMLEEHLLTSHYRERPVGLLMRGLAAGGRPAEALRVFARFRAELREDVGVEPTRALREIETAILGQVDGTRDVPGADRRLPDGTVTFLITAIDGANERWQADEVSMAAALAGHDELVRSTVDTHGGVVVKHASDGAIAVFTSARQAAHAAVDAQLKLDLPVRIGLHTGQAELRDGEYIGAAVNRVARFVTAGHAGQILLSASTAALLDDAALLDHGEHRLAGVSGPVHIYQLGEDKFPPLRTAREVVGNLPVELDEFVGRGDAVRELAGEIAAHRLVTLLGVGGAGKTRLAIETAVSAARHFPDGCWFIDLSAVADKPAVDFAFVTGVGRRPVAEGDVIDALGAALRHKRLLMLVDNCEHVLETAADRVERILRACPDIAVLATSREPLLASGERVVPIPPLMLDEAERLFLGRAHAGAGDAELDDTQMAAVSQLCERLDRLPLAIELAAARSRAFAPTELLAQIGDRFRLLVGGRRTRSERQQTMRAALDWSYELCDERQRAMFDQLSVFPAGFDAAAAQAVTAGGTVSNPDVVDTLAHLVDRSLVQRTSRPDGTSRYSLLETMRAYGREHLRVNGEIDEVVARHAQHTKHVVYALSLRSIGPDERVVSALMSELLPDIRAAVTWFVDSACWDDAFGVTWTLCAGESARELYEQELRLLDEMIEAGSDSAVLDALKLDASYDGFSKPDVNRRAWKLIAAGWPRYTDRLDFVPHMYVVTDDDAAELLAELDRLVSFPDATRFWAELFVVERLIDSHPLLAQERLTQLDEWLDSIRGEFVQAYRVYVSGRLDFAHGEWAKAAAQFQQASASDVFVSGSPVKAACDIYNFTASALAGLPVTGAQLSDPWRSLREGLLWNRYPFAAAFTATALDRDNPALARRFGRWVVQTTNPDVVAVLEERLAAAGFRLDRTPGPLEDLDELLAELDEFADHLDQRS